MVTPLRKVEVPYRQSPPFAMQVELTEGCNLRCVFCGLNGIRGKNNDFKFMSLELAEMVVHRIREAKWTPRVEFAMHGEPSANPQAAAIVELFRRRLPRVHLMMTSNGYGFMKEPTESVDRVLRWLNVLALDWYENVQIVPKILERYSGKHNPIFYPKETIGNPHRRRMLSEHDFVIVQDIKEAVTGTHSMLNNHAGCGAPKNLDAAGKRCAKPFRELSIRWDGNVAICCNDWRGEFKCGSVVDLTLDQIWNGDAMQAARRKLYHGERTFGPCLGCDATSYRPGLLPDQRGKTTLPTATEADDRTIAAALGGKTLALPVLRPWE